MKDTAQVFEDFFGGSGNIVTPHLLRYEQVGNFHIEVCKGNLFFNRVTYGLTVIEETPEGEFEIRRDLSGAFFEKYLMERYIELLEQGQLKEAIKLHGRHVEKH